MKDDKYFRIQKNRKLLAVLLAFLLMLSAGCSHSEKAAGGFLKDVKYTLHIGLNDKDTYKQEISDEKALQIITDTSLKFTDGFTVYKSQGVYKDTKGEITRENGMVVEFYGANEGQVKNIMNELLVSLNQESILLEQKEVEYKFYNGKGVQK